MSRRARRASPLVTCACALLALLPLAACGETSSDDGAPDKTTSAGAASSDAAPSIVATRENALNESSAEDAAADAAPSIIATREIARAPDAPPAIPFTDVTHAAGIDFVHENGARGAKLLPETMGGGCAFLDADRDGDADLLLVNGRPWPDAPDAQSSDAHTTYYRNDGRGAFIEASRECGLDLRVQGMGAAVGDCDGDGDDDLFVTALGPDVLLRNDDLRFVDVTASAGVGGASDAWSTAACFVDVDRDGDLDLFVGHYVEWSPERDLAQERTLEGIAGRAYLPPMSFPGTQPALFRNDGRGVFADVSATSGVRVVDEDGRPVAKMLALLPFDADADGDVDLFVSNDTTRNFLYTNRGDGVFDETGVDAGLAYDRLGQPTGAMGVDAGDLRGDGATTLVVGNFADEMTSAYVAAPGGGFFTDETVAIGLGAPTRWALTFGLLLFDADLDGRLDLLTANGHLEESIADAQPGQSYAQAPQLFWNTGAARGPLLALADDVGDLARPIVGRGAAAADVDGDGDLDLLLTQPGAAPRLLRNDQRSGNAWLAVDLRGSASQPIVAGARVALTADGRTQEREVRPTRSYLSAVPSTLVFGLGLASAIESLVVTWPDGSVQDVPPPAPSQKVAVTKDTERPDPAGLMNTAKAQLENGDATGAQATLERALALRPESAPILRNLARAKLLAADPEGALPLLARARAADPQSAATVYLTGIALARASRYDEAVPVLEDAARRDPLTAAIRFQLGNAYELVGREDDALAQYRETARLDPAHSAAQFKLALAARKRGDTAEYRDRNREFLRLKALYGDAYKTPVSLERCVHTLAEAGDEAEDANATWPQIDVAFVDVTDAWLGERSAAALAASAIDDAGRLTFTAVGEDGTLVELAASDAGPLGARTLTAEAPPGVGDLVVGNVYDPPQPVAKDALPVRRPDLVLAAGGHVTLLERDAGGDYADTTSRAGLDEVRAGRVTLVDADHDGDLDLLAVGENGVRLMLASGDGELVDGTAESGIPELGACVDVAAADLDGNGAVDFVVARGDDTPTIVLENLRAGRFAEQPEPPGPLPAARRVLLEHLDADDDPDVLLVARDAVHVRRAQGTLQQTIALDGLDARGATLLDHDADGRADLLVVGARDGHGALLLLRNAGDGTLVDATSACKLDALALPPLADALAADVDRDGDDDLLLRASDGSLHALRNDGGSANGQLALRLFSLVNTSGGIGTRVQVRASDFVASRLASAEQPVTIGLGGRTRLDSVQTLWPNGIVDNRLDVEVGPRPLDVVILEQVDTGSCPFLFVWDGERFRFVNDMIGSGAVGLPLTRDVMCPVNPSEIVEVGPEDLLVPVDGHYAMRVTSELREAAYYDHVALMAVDHAPGLEVHSTDRLRGPPFPASEPWLLADPQAPKRALGDDGLDRTSAVAALDGVFAPPGPVLPAPLRGVCAPMTLELDFGPLPDADDLVLALTGWIEYGTASSQIALSQDTSVATIWPRLEARASDGSWTPLDVFVGLPAGKIKTLLVELGGRLPEGADRLRLTTTFQLSWDRIALGRRAPLDPAFVHTAEPDRAELRWRGHSDLRVRAPGAPRTPDYDVTIDVPPWRTSLQGWCTRFGDVLPLLDEIDGKVCVLNGGDEMQLTVPVDAFPPLPEGLERTWMWWSHGWNKEGDPNTSGGDSIWPLGVDIRFGRTPEEDDAWRLLYNTRWVSADRYRRATSGTR
ncbi:MAG: VCBS repeat-containing protein [Planctomycetes bacterium]|nr:VCBS repeat-containing protein [Planctomycetota bacterium]